MHSYLKTTHDNIKLQAEKILVLLLLASVLCCGMMMKIDASQYCAFAYALGNAQIIPKNIIMCLLNPECIDGLHPWSAERVDQQGVESPLPVEAPQQLDG